MFDRRELLQHATLLSLASTVPAFLRAGLAAMPQAQDRILVVIQLSGGNDGLNTIVPFKDDQYAASRQALRLPEDRLIGIDDETAWHPAMRAMADLLDDGRLAIVQGAGYPEPNRSHEVSMAVWHTAHTDPEEHRGYGWLGRTLDRLPITAGQASSVVVSNVSMPAALRGRKTTSAAMDSLRDFQIAPDELPTAGLRASSSLAEFMRRTAVDAHATAQRVQAIAASTGAGGGSSLARLRSTLARHLKVISDLIRADFGPRVYYAVQPGYDTHSEQLQTHAQLLRTLSVSVKAFLDDMVAAGNADRVVVLCFSEFGRQVKENASEGTDHGTAGPVILAGDPVVAGIHGRAPDLTRLDGNAPQHTVDFRSIYARVLRDWFQLKPNSVLTNFDDSTPLQRLFT